MYATFFGLSREPFSLAPDPRFLYMSERHREALAHLLYGVRGGGGFVLLTGEIGAGKTTVARCFLEQLPPHCVVAYIFNPCLSVIELLQTVCSEFGLPTLPSGASVKTHVDALNSFLLEAHAKGRHALLVIDEAQALEAPLLEQLRLLTNLETSERKLLQIILIGQPELRTMLAEPGLEQLAQRVIARYHLGPLTTAETRQYVEHRLAVAGLRGPVPFDAGALAAIHRGTGGVPRRINLLADRALLGAYGRQRREVDRAMVARAAQEVFDRPSSRRRTRGRRAPNPLSRAGLLAGLTAVSLVFALALAWWVQRTPDGTPTSAPLAKADALTPLGAASAPLPAQAPVRIAAAASEPAAAPVVAAKPVAAATPLSPEVPSVRALDSAADLMAGAHLLEGTAWRELALRWHVAIGEGDACLAALQAELACFRSGPGSLALLRQLQRPALLPLRQARGPRVHAVLVALGPEQATLQAGSRQFNLPLSALLEVWQGDFATFWRTPPGWRARPGADPAAGSRMWQQQWLAQLEPALQSRPWTDQVAAFQARSGLPVDGLAGPLTLMQLNRSAGVEEPRLALTP
jgi:general secretion pathway protein A